MSRRIPLLCLVAFSIGTLPAASVVDSILTRYDQLRSYESSFTQINIWPGIDTLTTNGTMRYNSTNLLLTYNEPAGQFAFVGPDEIVVYDRRSNQALVANPDSKHRISRPIDYLYHLYEYSTIETHVESVDSIRIELRPPPNKTIDRISRLVLIVNRSSFLIRALQLFDMEGNIVIYRFRDIQINPSFHPEAFTYHIPEDALVIDQRNRE